MTRSLSRCEQSKESLEEPGEHHGEESEPQDEQQWPSQQAPPGRSSDLSCSSGVALFADRDALYAPSSDLGAICADERLARGAGARRRGVAVDAVGGVRLKGSQVHRVSMGSGGGYTSWRTPHRHRIALSLQLFQRYSIVP